MGENAMILVFKYWVLSQLFHSPRSPGEETVYSLQYSGLENSRLFRPWDCREWTQLSYFHFLLSSRGPLVPLPFLPLKWYHLHIWGCWYFSWQFRFQLITHPARMCYMMCSTYKLNKHGDNKQPCHTPFSILNQSFVPCKVLTVVSSPTHRFLRR